MRGDSDPEVVGAPVDDGLFDGLGIEVLGEGSVGEGGKFGVRGEAEGDELAGGEFADVYVFVCRKERGQPEPFFEADDAVLYPACLHSADQSHEDEGEGHDDPPVEEVFVGGKAVDCNVDGKDKVDDEDRHQDEVESRVATSVALVALRCRHGWSFHRSGRVKAAGLTGPDQHNIWMLSLCADGGALVEAQS